MQQKTELRKAQLEQTKSLLEQLSKMKDVDPKQKLELMKRISSLTHGVSESLAKDSTSIKTADKPKTPLAPKDKERELLDRELDLITRKPAALAPTTAAAVTVTEGHSPAPAVTSTLSSEVITASPMSERKKSIVSPIMAPRLATALRARGGIRGALTRGRARGRGRGAAFALDNRTTTLRLTGVPAELREQEALQKHFRVRASFAFPPLSCVSLLAFSLSGRSPQ